MLNILVVYAVKEERVVVEMPNCSINYCLTGVGKVSATIAVEKAIAKYKPDLVLNIGTAGTLNYEIGSVHICDSFIDRDMEKLQNLGVPFEENFKEELNQLTDIINWKFDSTCNTGDTFLTSADGTGDVFDMESFAVARVCKNHQLPFCGIKCVTDIIGENSIKHWEEKLAEAQAILQKFIDENPLIVPDNYIGKNTEAIIQQYKLQEHPEGGWYKETFRSDQLIKANGLPSEFDGDRSGLTSIYYLLEGSNYSAFHRIKSPEIWFFHHGLPLLIHMIDASGKYSTIELSDQKGGLLQYTVQPNVWFAATIKDKAGYGFVSCAVAPGFDFNDFEMAQSDELMQQATDYSDIIKTLCKQ